MHQLCAGGNEQNGCIPDNCGPQCGGEGPDVPPPDSWYPALAERTNMLGAGPEFSNNMSAPHNCVGGSEASCIPKNCGAGCGSADGGIPPPAKWYATTEHTNMLGAGPEWYNNMSAPNNCVGGGHGVCIPPGAGAGAGPVTAGATTAHTNMLSAGPEFYNNMNAPFNCVGK